MSAAELHRHLRRLQQERLDAEEIGLPGCEAYRHDLERETAACHAAYVGAAVTEIAVLHGQVFGRQIG